MGAGDFGQTGESVTSNAAKDSTRGIECAIIRRHCMVVVLVERKIPKSVSATPEYHALSMDNGVFGVIGVNVLSLVGLVYDVG